MTIKTPAEIANAMLDPRGDESALLRDFPDSRKPDVAEAIIAAIEADRAQRATASRIPAEMTAEIDRVVGHQDYAAYVLDYQVAEHETPHAAGVDSDCYHDVIALADDGDGGPRIINFTMQPDGSIDAHPEGK